MNKTNFEHAFAAVVLQIILAGVLILFGAFVPQVAYPFIAGAALGVGVFIGREHAQAEHRYIYRNGGQRWATPRLPELQAFKPEYWDDDSVLDIVVPLVSVVIVCVIAAWGLS